MPPDINTLTEGQRCFLEIASDMVDARIEGGSPIEVARRFAKGHFKVRVFSEPLRVIKIVVSEYDRLFELTDLGWFEETRGTFRLTDVSLCLYAQPGAAVALPPKRLRYSGAGEESCIAEIRSRVAEGCADGLGSLSADEQEARDWVLDDPLTEHLIDSFSLHRRGIHGFGHWSRVMREGLRLASIAGANHRVIAWFSLLHDLWRVDEGSDPRHGERAAEEVENLVDQGLLALDTRAADQLIEAIRGHSRGELHADPTIACCWDADRLDLVRLGVCPDWSRLSTHAARERLVFWLDTQDKEST